MVDLESRMIVLANRAPVKHDLTRGGVVATRSASGLVTALEPLLTTYSGTWVAHAAGSADTSVVDALGGVDVPPANPQYRKLVDDVSRYSSGSMPSEHAEHRWSSAVA